MAEGIGPLQITVLGSGTSVGVPTIGCDCKVCRSEDPRDKRLRPSVLVSWSGHNVLIDTTPDFRQQALRAQIPCIDAILYTHAHADHMMGLDDVRPFNYKRKDAIPIYGSAQTAEAIRRCFPYIFAQDKSESSKPKIDLYEFDDMPIPVYDLEFKPIPLNHGSGVSHGFRFGAMAYLTDHSDIPAESAEKLQGLDVLFLDALRYKPHPTHSTVDRSLKWVEQLAPKRAFFTHLCHDLGHERAESMLPPHVRLAYDGLVVTAEAAE